MKRVYFVYRDAGAYDRQSDGVEFCVIPEFHDEKIYFYCNEYSIFWKSIEEVGDFDKSCDFKLKKQIRPATLTELCRENIANHVNTIKEYNIENNSLKGITYIHLE